MYMLQEPVIIEHFFGVYLLVSINPKYLGRVYIGYTRDPAKRIAQHNCGVRAGGARRTSCKGPWQMVLVVHGFHHSVSALRFEWAWQHPRSSLGGISRKKCKESRLEHSIRIMCLMLRSAPWHKQPLTIRWLSEEHMQDFHPAVLPPVHMPIVFGPVITKKLPKQSLQNNQNNTDTVTCFLCNCEVDKKQNVECINPNCSCVCHLMCLAKHFIGNEDSLLPVEGNCPSCGLQVLWGDLIRKKRGCVVNFEVSELSCLQDEQFSKQSNSSSEDKKFNNGSEILN